MKLFTKINLLLLVVLLVGACKSIKKTKQDGYWGNMVKVKGGSYMMGCTSGDSDCERDETQHQVQLDGFYISKYEVTQQQWFDIMGDRPSYNKNCNSCPVERVTHDDIQTFLRKLNAKTGKNYRLPTEAEWEYAARGGRKSRGYKYSGSNNIDDVAWYRKNSYDVDKKTSPVGRKRANELGLYDMTGNVWEWCSDWYTGYDNISSSYNPAGASSGSSRVFRGGSWYINAESCRVSNRSRDSPSYWLNDVGFRLAHSHTTANRLTDKEEIKLEQAPKEELEYDVKEELQIQAPEQELEKYDYDVREKEQKQKEQKQKKDAILQKLYGYWDNMVKVKGGSYLMGCRHGDNGCYDLEKPQHRVELSTFYISKYEVTQQQWSDIMGRRPSHHKNCNNCPVEQVRHDEIQIFLQKLNEKTGKNYRLPTEAEWEYAARGGNKSKGYKYSGSNNIDDVAWYSENSRKLDKKTSPVGRKRANELGLYDMTGNVWEWCSDWYAKNYYNISSRSNPKGASHGSSRVCRGGSWLSLERHCRVYYRESGLPTYWDWSRGFRLAHSSD